MIDKLKKQLKGKNKRIVFPEGEDVRIQKAAELLVKDKILSPVLIGDIDKIKKVAKDNKIDLKDIELISLGHNFKKYQEMEDLMTEVRKGKMSRSEVRNLLQSANYFAAMLVKIGYVDVLLGGARFSTADIVRPALQLFKRKPGVKIVSSCYLMLKTDAKNKDYRAFIFADGGLNIAPTSSELVEIATQSADTAKLFGMKPNVAFLSYSTLGSGKGEAVDKVTEAVRMLDQINPDFHYAGEYQVDTALSPEVAKIKAPNDKEAGHANVLIFPDISSGNISYKLVERLGGYHAFGPILQGLNAPICDLSRGCSSSDVYNMAYITAIN